MAGHAKTLNPRQEKFLAVYNATGNVARAYQRAGYKARGAEAQRKGNRLLKSPLIQAALRKQARQLAKNTPAPPPDVPSQPPAPPSIAPLQERLEFLTSVMRDAKEKTDNRIWASVELSKHQGEYKHNDKRPGLNVLIHRLEKIPESDLYAILEGEFTAALPEPDDNAPGTPGS